MTPVIPDEFLKFFDFSPQAMWVFNLDDARFLAVNRAACSQYGYSQEEFLGMTLYDLRPSREWSKVAAALTKIKEGGGTGAPMVWEHYTKEGRRIFVEVLSTAVQVEDSKVIFAVVRDVTKEHELKAEQIRFFDLSEDMMVIRDLNDRLVNINAAATKILGWSAEEIASMRPSELIHPEDNAVREERFRQARMDGSSRTWEARLRTKEGGYRWLQWSGTVDLEHGRAYAVARDITEAREMHDRLRASEADLAWAQGVSHLGSWRLDLATGVFNLSDEYYRITGYEPGGYAPTWENVISCVHPDDRWMVEVPPDRLSSETPHMELDVRILRPNGEIRNVRSYVESAYDAGGKLLIMHGTIQDITEQKKAQEIQTWLAEIVSSSSDAIIGKSLDGVVLSWNKAAERLYGYSAEEMIGQSIKKLIPDYRREELDMILSKLRRGERIQEFETERVTASGRVFEATVTISPIQTEGGQIIGAATIARDISARKDAERKLASRLAQLTALRSIDVSIAGTFELERTLEIVAAQTMATTDVDAVFLFVKDRQIDQSLLVARDGIWDGERQAIAQALSNQSIAERRTVTTINADGAGFEARPLMTKGAAQGALTVALAAGRSPSGEQSSFLDTLAGQAAIAVESASLFQDLRLSHEALEAAYDESLEGWARALDLRDRETEGHSRRVTDLTVRLATELGIPVEELPHIRRGALLHDIGKLGVPDHILLKPGPLSDEEWEVMRKHPTYGRNILAPIAFLGPALPIPYSHHEKWDGSGYPLGLAGEDIPLAARIFALADVWDALTSDRPYRKGWPAERVCQHIQSEAGTHFDPSIVPIFLRLVTAG